MRRLVTTVPLMLGATVAGFVFLPLAIALLIVSDLLRGKARLPRLRVYLFALQYGFNDSVEIVLAPIYWVLAGFGTRLASPASLARHRRLQSWSLELLARRAEQLLGLPVQIDNASRAVLRPGPVVVIARHASLFDASLPALVFGREGFAVRGVVMAELLADPGFDLIYGRLGSVFIARDDGPSARSAIDAMATAAQHDGDDLAIGIFPEGRLFRPSVRDRLLTRLQESDPERAQRLNDLTHLLPPRPTGLRILLEKMTTADLVVLDHEGLDSLGSLGQLANTAPLNRPVTVTARRIPRSEIPGLNTDAGSDRDTEALSRAFARWLDELWLELDEARRGM